MINYSDFKIDSLLDNCKFNESLFRIAPKSIHKHSLDATTMAIDLIYMTKGQNIIKDQVSYINSHQNFNLGLFQENFLSDIDTNDIRNSEMSAVYLTYHVAMLYEFFNIKLSKKIDFFDNLKDKKQFNDFFLDFIPWNKSTMGSGNIIDHYSSAFRANSRFDSKYDDLLKWLYIELEKIECPITGFYGSLNSQGFNGLVQGGYHILRGTYFYDNKDIRYVNQKIDTILQSIDYLNKTVFSNGKGEGCHDMDHFMMLNKLSKYSTYKKSEILSKSEDRLKQILSYSNPEGGFSFNITHSIENHNRYNTTMGEKQGDLVGSVFYLETIKNLAEILGENVNWKNSIIHG